MYTPITRPLPSHANQICHFPRVRCGDGTSADLPNESCLHRPAPSALYARSSTPFDLDMPRLCPIKEGLVRFDSSLLVAFLHAFPCLSSVDPYIPCNPASCHALLSFLYLQGGVLDLSRLSRLWVTLRLAWPRPTRLQILPNSSILLRPPCPKRWNGKLHRPSSALLPPVTGECLVYPNHYIILLTSLPHLSALL